MGHPIYLFVATALPSPPSQRALSLPLKLKSCTTKASVKQLDFKKCNLLLKESPILSPLNDTPGPSTVGLCTIAVPQCFIGHELS